MANRRMSICLEDTKSDIFGSRVLSLCEYGSLTSVLGFWGYFMYECLRPHSDHINFFGITFYKGTAFDLLIFNAIIYFNFFGCLHILMMLCSKHSNMARAICGYNNVDQRQSCVMTVLSAIYFNTILGSTAGLGDFYPTSSISMAVASLQVGCFYFLTGQYVYSLFWKQNH